MKLTLPDGPFKAFLFDCDGTIVDSMPLHYVAWNKALSEWSCEFTEDLFYAWGGMPVAEIIATLNERQGLAMPVEEGATRKEQLYFDILPELKAVPEVLEHIHASHGRIPFAVVSGSTRDSVTRSLDRKEMTGVFDAQAPSGAVLAGGEAAWDCAEGLPGVRGYGDGDSVGDGGRDGFGEDCAAVGAGCGGLI